MWLVPVGPTAQRWLVPDGDDTYHLISVHSGKALDVLDASRADGGTVVQWTYGGATNQQWQLQAPKAVPTIHYVWCGSAGLVRFMTKAEFKKADVLFRQGEQADKLYYLVSGSIHFSEIEATAAPGNIIGEIGVFSPSKTRTASAIAESDSALLILSDQKALELYYQNPEFGIYLVRMIIQHLMYQRRLGHGEALVPIEKLEADAVREASASLLHAGR